MKKTNILILILIISSQFFTTCKKESVLKVASEYEGIWRDMDKCSSFSKAAILKIDNESYGSLNLLNPECHSGKVVAGSVKLKGKYLYIGFHKFQIKQVPTKIDTVFFYKSIGYSTMEMVLVYKGRGINVGNRVYHFNKLN